MTIDNELIDNLLKDYKKPEDIIGENGLLKQLTKQLLERAMAAEMTEHVGYEKHDVAGNRSGNSRNGKSAKTLKGSFGTMPIEVPRDRNGTFEPQIIEKHQTRFTGFDANIISLYARGLSTREIQQHLEEIYHVEVSPALISSVTDEVLDEVKTWQNRQLDEVYPIMYLDAIQFKVRDSGHVKNKAIYLAIGVTLDGLKEVLGLWIAQTEGAKFWLQVVTELKNRGVTDIFIACVDGLKGFPEAIETVFPQTEVQLCIVHLVRYSLNYVGWKQRKEVAADLKLIYTSATEAEAEQRLAEFSLKWDAKFPTIAKSWRSNWALTQCLNLSLWPSIPVAVLVAILVGLSCELAVYRPMRDRKAPPFMFLVASIGLYIIFYNCISLYFGDDAKILESGPVKVANNHLLRQSYNSWPSN